jgi:MYXO-CTERM domain-containing protein
VQGGGSGSGTCSAGLQLAQGLSCTVTLSFSPGSPGAHAARLQVLSSGTALAPLPLVGTGLGPATDTPLTLSTSHLGFGATRTGSASLPMEVLLQAGTLAAVQVVGWTVEGPFLVENRSCPPLPFTLAAGSPCAVVVRFLPGVAGEATGTLQVTSSDATSSPASVRRVALSGQGQASADVVDGGGGCSMARPGHPGRIDPVLPLLAVGALWVLWRRRSVRHAR